MGNCHRPQHHRAQPAERRTGKRLLCSDLIRLRWTEVSGAHREEIAIVEDLSPSGANLFMGVPVAAGTAVILCTQERHYPAAVCACAPAPNGHMIRIHVEEAWAATAGGAFGYTPEHLLDVTRLDFTPGE
jgi:hypothetical protein